MAHKVWNFFNQKPQILLYDIKQLESLTEFKKVIKQWKPTYVYGGYVKLSQTQSYLIWGLPRKFLILPLSFKISNYLFHFYLRIVKSDKVLLLH